jgi:TetR/AcrR family transcriptional regulator, mexJK operon transcriptional repressor
MPSQTGRKVSQKSVQARANALLEAERLYGASTYEAIHLQTVAKAIGISKAALLDHFDGKPALFTAMLEAILERCGLLISANAKRPFPSSEARFLALSLALSKQPIFDAFRFLRSEQHHLLPEQQGLLRRSGNELLFYPIKKLFAVALERQELRTPDTGMASDLFLGFCVLVSSMRSMESGVPTVARHKEMFAMFWHGAAVN